ncbi:MAG: XdhC family protein [Polaromonas sp.]
MDDLDLWQLSQQMRRDGKPFALLTVVRAVSPTSAHIGAKAIVEADGTWHGWIGGGCVRSVVDGVARDAIATGRSRLVRISPDSTAEEAGIEIYPMTCASNGTIEVFVEAFADAPLALVAGGTPVARSVVALALRMGLRVAHADPSGNFTDDLAMRIDAFEVESFAANKPRWCIVATQGDGDLAACDAALASGAERILLVASTKKAAKLIADLSAKGHAKQQIARVLKAPAGLAIGAETPEEIALSIVAELVALRRGVTVQPAQPVGAKVAGVAIKSSLPMPVKAPLEGGAIDPVCGMRVNPVTAESSEWSGQRFYFCCAGCRKVFDLAPERYVASLHVEGA